MAMRFAEGLHRDISPFEVYYLQWIFAETINQ